MYLRILADIIIFLSILFLPWWVTIFLVLFGIFFFNHFYEAIIAGILIDLLYGTRAEEFFGIWFLFFIIFSSIYFFGEKLKKNIR